MIRDLIQNRGFIIRRAFPQAIKLFNQKEECTFGGEGGLNENHNNNRGIKGSDW